LHAASLVFQTRHKAVFVNVHAARHRGPCQPIDQLCRIDQRIIRLEKTGAIFGRSETLIERRAFEKLGLDPEARISGLHRAQSFGLPWRRGDVQLAAALKLAIDVVMFQIALERIQIFAAQPDQRLGLARPAGHGIRDPMRDAGRAKAPVPSAGGIA